MDLIGGVFDAITRNVVGTFVSVGIVFVWVLLGKKLIIYIRENVSRFVSDWIIEHLDQDERLLAKQVVHYVEMKIPDAPGEKKKSTAVAGLRRVFPGLDEKGAGDLIEFSVAEMNIALKEIESRI